MRSGTLNVPGIAGLGAACEIAKAGMPEEAKRMRFLRDKLKDKLVRAIWTRSISTALLSIGCRTISISVSRTWRAKAF